MTRHSQKLSVFFVAKKKKGRELDNGLESKCIHVNWGIILYYNNEAREPPQYFRIIHNIVTVILPYTPFIDLFLT